MSETRYTRDHEWVRLEKGVATIGITNYAQAQLGDIVFVELPAASTDVEAGTEAAVVESVKAASEVIAPVSGTVVEVNENLADSPGTVNEDAEGAGWFVKLRVAEGADLDDLMDAAAYAEYVAGLE
jgi:glycine cleavage system H protein